LRAFRYPGLPNYIPEINTIGEGGVYHLRWVYSIRKEGRSESGRFTIRTKSGKRKVLWHNEERISAEGALIFWT
jgi:hypothetical protein